MRHSARDVIVALLPICQMGEARWDWPGSCLARLLGEKLILSGFAVIPYYDLAHLWEPFDTSLLTRWEEAIRMSEHLPENISIIAGSYVSDEKRVLVNIYAIRGTGVSLLVREEDERETLFPALDHACQRLVGLLGGPVDVTSRERIEMAVATESLEAFRALAEARAAWADGDLEAVRAAVARAQELDPDFHEPLDVLRRATGQLGTAKELREAQKAQLTHLIALNPPFKALAVIEEILEFAQRKRDRELEDDCLKAKGVVESNSNMGEIIRLYAEHARESENRIAALLPEDLQPRWRILRTKGWSAGQIVALYLMAQSWLEQARLSQKVGYFAEAGRWAQRARDLFALLGSTARRQEARRAMSEAQAALAAARASASEANVRSRPAPRGGPSGS